MICEYNSNAKLKDIIVNKNGDMSSHIFLNNQDRSIDKFCYLNTDKPISNLYSKKSFNNQQIKKNSNKIVLRTKIDVCRNEEKNLRNEGEVVNNSVFDKKPKLSNVNIKIPPDTLELFYHPEICQICFEEKIVDINKAEFACGHKFCKKCVTNYLRNSIVDGKVILILLNLNIIFF